jgi:hypothetical protein
LNQWNSGGEAIADRGGDTSGTHRQGRVIDGERLDVVGWEHGRALVGYPVGKIARCTSHTRAMSAIAADPHRMTARR